MSFPTIEPNIFQIWMKYIILTFYVTDLIVNFNTAYFKNGFLVTSRKDIIKNYLKFWFWIDLIATMPIEDIMSLT